MPPAPAASKLEAEQQKREAQQQKEKAEGPTPEPTSLIRTGRLTGTTARVATDRRFTDADCVISWAGRWQACKFTDPGVAVPLGCASIAGSK